MMRPPSWYTLQSFWFKGQCEVVWPLLPHPDPSLLWMWSSLDWMSYTEQKWRWTRGWVTGVRGSLYYYWSLIFIQKETLEGAEVSLTLRFSLFPNFSLPTRSSSPFWAIFQALSLAYSLTTVHISSFCPLPGWIWTHKSLRCDTLLSGLLILCPHAVCLLWLSLWFSHLTLESQSNKRQRGKIYKTKGGGVGTKVKNGVKK